MSERIEDLLARSARLYPDVVCVDDGRARLTFAELLERVDTLASALAGSGLQPGQRVAVLARNRWETVALYFACARLNAVLVPLNWRLKGPELAYILHHCPPRVVVSEPAFAEVLERHALRPVPVSGRLLLDGWREGWHPFDGLPLAEPGPIPGSRDESQVVVQMYSSGTTGRPKGAQLTHRNIVSLTHAWLLDMRLDPGASRFLQVTPLFHVGGMLMLMSTVAAGATLHLLPEFDPVAALDALEEHRITHTLMVPSMVQWCLLDPTLVGRLFPELRLIVYGASPMPVAVLRRAMEVFRCDFLQGYGLTETAGVVLTLTPEDHRWPEHEDPPQRLAAAGREVACSQVRVVDEQGREVAPGVIGEIVARGPNVTPGYYGDEAATREALRDGWFYTGDLATVDAAGYVYVVDRKKDMILVGGENVYPREVEEVLMAHPAVADAAVVGVPHEVWGEEVLAFVVLRESEAPPSSRALVRHCRETLARFKCPTRVELRDALPRNAAGKLQKRVLRDPYWSDRARQV